MAVGLVGLFVSCLTLMVGLAQGEFILKASSTEICLILGEFSPVLRSYFMIFVMIS
jgi:hypothetical protein